MANKPRVLERSEIDKLFAGLPGKSLRTVRFRAALELLYRGGLRVAEACAVRPGDILWQSGKVVVACGKGGKERKVEFCDAKSGALIIDTLLAWEAMRPKPAHYFLCKADGGKLSTRYIQARLKRLANKVLPPERAMLCTPHVLRHTRATDLLEDGWPLTDVQAFLGHSTPRTTTIYIHLRGTKHPERLRERAAMAAQLETQLKAIQAQLLLLQNGD